MKKTNFIIALFTLFFISCASKEKKAEKLIKEELSETLLDFESYEPIKTKVVEAKQTMYNDTACRRKALLLYATMQVASGYMKDADKAKDHMDIWTPSYYSTSYSRSQYTKYREEYLENTEKAKLTYGVAMSFGKELKKKISELDTTKVIGWIATHRFRCKNRGGNLTMGDYKYLIDKDFNEIIYSVDMDEDDEKNIIETLDYAVDHEFEDLE